MCTLSVIPIQPDANQPGAAAGIRLAFNRDERRARPAAQPPRRHCFGERETLMPTDTAAGGTWIAVNDAGLALALLNVNPPPSALAAEPAAKPFIEVPRLSRGKIIPSLLHHDSVDAALQQALALRAEDYPPFRLVICSTRGCIELASDGHRVRCGAAILSPCIGMFTSSGLGDHLVDRPRRTLFEQMLGDGRHSPPMQDAFHRHQWRDRTHLSVNMIRPDARTVSRVIVELTSTQAAMSYASLDETGAERDCTADALAIAPSGKTIAERHASAECQTRAVPQTSTGCQTNTASQTRAGPQTSTGSQTSAGCHG